MAYFRVRRELYSQLVTALEAARERRVGCVVNDDFPDAFRLAFDRTLVYTSCALGRRDKSPLQAPTRPVEKDTPKHQLWDNSVHNPVAPATRCGGKNGPGEMP